MSNAAQFLQLINSPVKFRLFLLSKLPAAFISGVRVRSADENKCVVTVPYKWLSQNPFKSIYFACLSMAAEMSTGVLAMAHIYKRNPSVSMLVLKVEGSFMKKAVGRTTFTCEEGQLIRQTIEDAIISNEGKMVTARSYGRNKEGEVVAEFSITWSFKAKSNIT
ncbi:MAG TPA: PaaI family thioesterase [Ferruginibacter sp.]|mgnify:FL=1|nr:PaaI family thioesterase [Ferruginibacter sp.]